MKRLSVAIVFAVVLVAVFAFLPVSGQSADAYTGTVTVSETDGVFSYEADGDHSGNFTSLQSLIDDARSHTPGLLTLSFYNNVTSSSPIVLTGNVAIGGQLTFSFPTDGQQSIPALTINPEGSLTVMGASITVNDGSGIDVNNTASLSFRTGTINVNQSYGAPAKFHYAIKVLGGGTADVTGISINYSNTIGDGIIVQEGATLSISKTNETAVSISAPTALNLSGGTTTVSAGAFSSSCDGDSVKINSGATLTVSGGTFENTIFYSGSSHLTIADGTFGTLKLQPTGTGPYSGDVTLSDARVRPAQNSNIFIDLSDFDNDLVTFSTSIGNSGYRATAATTDSVDRYFIGDPMPIDADVTYTFIENNQYVLSVYDRDTEALVHSASYAYGTNFVCANIDINKPGYSATEWHEDYIYGDVITSFTLQGDKTLYAVISLNACEVTLPNTTLTYNGNAQSITATVTHALKTDPSATYSATWEKFVSSDWQAASANETLIVTAHSDGGLYRFKTSITHNEITRITVEEVTVTVQKATYSNVTHDGFTGAYSDTQRLSDFSLDANFWWETPTAVPTVPQKQYLAHYNTDSANYEDADVYITIDLEKANVNPETVPSYSTIYDTYDPEKTLADYEIEENTRWVDPTVVPAANEPGHTSYQAVYNPDPDNYNDLTVYISLCIAKAEYPDKDFSIQLVYSSSLFSINAIKTYIADTYPGYAVTGSNAPQMGANAYSCVYNADPANYNDRACTLTLTFIKADYSASPVHPTVSLPHGAKLSEASLNSGFRFVNGDYIPEEPEGTYPAIYNADPTHYNDYATTIRVEVIKLVYLPSEIPTISLPAVVYSPTQTLADVDLDDGFSWADPTIVPTVPVTSYSGFYCGDIWHEAYEVDIPLTVTKATLVLPVLEDKSFVYDKQPHSLAYTSLPAGVTVTGYRYNESVEPPTHAGTYQVVMTVAQEDIVNYNEIPTEYIAVLTIQKAPSVIRIPTWVDVLVNGEYDLVGVVENDEQTLEIPEVDTKTVGTYVITVVAEESSNYSEGRVTVTVSVNHDKKYVGNITYPDQYDGSYFYGILSGENGVSEAMDVELSTVENSGHTKAMTVSLSHNGQAADGLYQLQLLLPADMYGKTITVSDENGPIDSWLQSGGAYLVFSVQNGSTVYFDYETKKPFVWYWIPPVAAVLVAGAVVLAVYLIRKKKRRSDVIDVPAAHETDTSVNIDAAPAKEPEQNETSSGEETKE